MRVVLGAGQRLCLVALSLWCLPVSSGWFMTRCGPHHPHAVPHSRPHRGLATAALALVCPHPATPAGSVVACGLGPLSGGCPDGQHSQEAEEVLLCQLFFPSWFWGSSAEVSCTHHIPVHSRCHLAAMTGPDAVALPVFKVGCRHLERLMGLLGPCRRAWMKGSSLFMTQSPRPSPCGWACVILGDTKGPGPLPPPYTSLRTFLLRDRSSWLLPRPELALPVPLNEPTQENNWVHIAGAQLAIERDENGASTFHGLREAHCSGLVPLLNGSLSWPQWTPLPWPVPGAPPRLHPGERGVRTDPWAAELPVRTGWLGQTAS